MKLNLLPHTVSKGRALRGGYVIGVLMVIVALILCAAMKFGPNQKLNDAMDRAKSLEDPAASALTTSQAADSTLSQASVLIRNASLAKALIAHNDVYPKLYSDVKQYIPSFFRLTSISAVPNDDTTCTVTLVGEIQSYHEYADLMLALMRWKDAKTISRSGYVVNLPTVPPISAQDQIGIPHRQDEPVVPSGQIDRLAYYENQNYAPKGYLGAGGFGGPPTEPRGATPGESTITVTMTVDRDLQVPDVAGTLASSGEETAAAPAGFGTGPMGPGGGPMGPGGGPMGLGGPTGGPPPPPGAPGGRG